MASYFGCDIMELLNGEFKPTDEGYVPPMPRSAVDSYQTFLRTASILEENEIKRVTQFMYQVLGERKDWGLLHHSQKQGKTPTFTTKSVVFVGAFLVHHALYFG